MRSVKKLSEKTLLRSRVLEVVNAEFEIDGLDPLERVVVRHPGAVVILPLVSKDRFILIKQYRYAIEEVIYELPAGTIEQGEQPLLCAQRELQEETGYGAKQWEALGEIVPAPGFCDEVQHLFLAEDLYPSKLEGDEDEDIEVVEMSLKELHGLIKRRELRDAKTLAALTLYQQLGE